MKFVRLKHALAGAAVALAMAFAPEAALAAKAKKLSAEQTAAVKELSTFMNSFKTIQGDFVQTLSNGRAVKGVFHIAKPGKMRFEYEKSYPILFVSDGNWVTIKYLKKGTGDQYPLSQTPLRMVLSDNVDFLKEAKILGIEEKEGRVYVALEDKKGMVAGHIILVYNKEGRSLEKWVVVDGKGRKTTVALQNVVVGVKADPKLFKVQLKKWKNPKDDF
jgi:outer membrane lipoprotein-sorting protein